MGKSGASSVILALFSGAILLAIAGCASNAPNQDAGGSAGPSASPSATDDDGGRGDPIDDPALSPPTTATVTMHDPVAQSFTVEVPEGWDTVAYSTGSFDDHREAVVSISPDGNTVLFLGDPKLPAYWDPDHPSNQTEFMQGWVKQSSVAEFRPYTYAVDWTQEYVLQKFGDLKGFLLLDTVDVPEQAQKLFDAIYQATGLQATVSVAHTDFTYETEAGVVSARVMASTVGNPQSWSADVQGLSTLGEVADYEPMLGAMARSKTTDPGWTARRDQVWAQQRAQSEAFTQQLISNHNANMAWIQNSAAAHQSRMQAIWAAGDASMQSYYGRMDAMDNNQRSFLNYISEENTVTGSSGQQWQVASGQTTYYVNPSNGQYVAGDINFDESDLRAMGLNPSDWELTQIVR